MDKEVESIINHIEKNENYLLSGGAGSGKTYSLVQVIREVIARFPSSKIACMTYTNASVHEIERRVDHSNLNVSTIHDFLWDNIKNFQDELKDTLIDLLNSTDSRIKLKGYEGDVPADFFYKERKSDFVIQYKEFTKLQDGVISHDEVLKLSERMFAKYTKIITFVKSRYPFIFIDEYQDTNPLIVKILLEYFPKEGRKCVVGFFGDSMQAIYDDGVGDIKGYLVTEANPKGCVYEVQKKQNRRCPLAVIQLANKLRLDNLLQEPYEHTKEGSVSFYYSETEKIDQLKDRLVHDFNWDFNDSNNTKELRLTHNLIASEAGFKTLMEIHDSDKIMEYCDRLKKYAQLRGVYDEITSMTLGEVISFFSSHFKSDEKKWSPTPAQQDFIETNACLYDEAMKMPFDGIACYVNKDQMLDDKSEEDSAKGTGSKLSPLNMHLHKIEHCIQLYLNKEYNEFMRSTSIKQISRASQKKMLREGIEKIISVYEKKTISEVIDLADWLGICIKDDKFETYIDSHPYLWRRIKDVEYQEARNLYVYRMGNQPFSTQHKTKGLEYNNVLVILKSNWSKYNFASLFYNNKKSTSIVERTKKLFYVCCTRAKENLVVYYPMATKEVVEGATQMFGEKNVYKI